MSDAELRVGMKIRDNDPRVKDRVLTVTGIYEHYVYAAGPHDMRATKIGRHRIYLHSEPRRNGWSVVP